MAYFYSHLVQIEEITLKLNELNLSDSQKKHLASLIDSTIHHTILDIIFSKLSLSDKEMLMYKIKNNPEDKEIMTILNDKVENIDMEIKEAVSKLKKELHEDVEEVKKHG
ncbi:MAG: hypothetical protein Q7R97_02625 [Candidatus Daviesbacteria bacterium]|nr:hypothetical protein [Candidatus Daviesbacteria bacterium]